MKQDKPKKYFIRDTSLRGVDDDMFNYADISKVLGKIVETNEPPYNVAVIGKWGLGKSSLINLVINKYKGKNEEFIIQEINAWKYEKEALGKVFLKQLWQGISKRKFKSFEVIRREFSDIINGDIVQTPSQDIKKKSTKMLCTAGVIAVATILIFIIYKLVQATILGIDVSTWSFWGQAFLSYCKNIATVLLFPVLIGFCKVMLDEYYSKAANKIELNFPIETVDDYEIFLESKIKEKLDKTPNLKVITIIDDLDRLSINKIVEALDALKAFVGFDRCIFIVPFDDEIIKLALEKRRIQQFDDTDDIIESELILDKLFQYKVYLPPLLSFDIKKYALNLVSQEIPDFLTDYCSLSTMEKLLNKIIIHSNVTTPRQVKKLINAFVNNYMACCEREASGRVQAQLFSSEVGQQQIAKFSVLQADFNDFYDLLFESFNYLSKLLEYHRNGAGIDVIPKSLSEYFIFDDSGANEGLKHEYEPLVNFLTHTAKYAVDNIAPYLYLAQDDISRKTGDETQRRAFNALESGNSETLRAMIADNSEVAETISYYLSDTNDELADALSAAMVLFDDVGGEHKNTLAQNIIDRVLETPIADRRFMYELPAEAMLEISNHSQMFREKFIDAYLTCLSTAEWLESNSIISALETLLAKWDSLSDENHDITSNITSLCISSDAVSVSDLVSIVQFEDSVIFDKLFGLAWFEKLCKYMDTDNDFSEEVINSFEKTFNALIAKNDVNMLMPHIKALLTYKELISTINLMFTEIVCEKLSSANATQIADAIITLDYEKCHEPIYCMLSKLNYAISKTNAAAFNKFTSNFKTGAAMHDVLVFCGNKNYFELLDTTITEVISSVFDNDENDKLLGKIQKYFTVTQRDALFSKLAGIAVFVSNAGYIRSTELISVLAKCDKNKEKFDALALSTLMPQFNPYYTHDAYFEFVSQSMGNIKSFLQQTTLDSYIAKIASVFANYRVLCLNAINRITGSITKHNFETLFPLLVTDTPTTSFEQTLDIVINCNSIRPTDSASLSLFRSFLVQNIEASVNPNRILVTLKNSFGFFSELGVLVDGAMKNKEVSQNELAEVIAHCFDNYKEIKKVAEELLLVMSNQEPINLLHNVLSQVKTYAINEILETLSTLVTDATTLDVLTNVIRLSTHYNLESSLRLMLKAVELTFAHDNQPAKLSQALRLINDFDKEVLRKSKNEIAPVLYNGFHQSTSDDVKGIILQVVSSNRLKPQFKGYLKDDDLVYYQKNI